MKKIISYIGCFTLVALLTNGAFAQTSDNQNQSYPRALEDKTASERLQKDWNKRNSNIKTESVQWFELSEGYFGSYSHENNKYMALYDQDGNYLHTYKKVDWTTVPATASIKSSYDLSNYKNHTVGSYWETSDADKKNYYFEIADEKGKVSHVWANDAGEFFSEFPTPKTKF